MDIAHRIGIWVAMAALGVYVLNIGQWVGAADEKFKDAQTVEQKQETIMLQQNTMVTEQKHMNKSIEENAKAIEESKREILAAIKEAHKDD